MSKSIRALARRPVVRALAVAATVVCAVAAPAAQAAALDSPEANIAIRPIGPCPVYSLTGGGPMFPLPLPCPGPPKCPVVVGSIVGIRCPQPFPPCPRPLPLDTAIVACPLNAATLR